MYLSLDADVYLFCVCMQSYKLCDPEEDLLWLWTVWYVVQCYKYIWMYVSLPHFLMFFYMHVFDCVAPERKPPVQFHRESLAKFFQRLTGIIINS